MASMRAGSSPLSLAATRLLSSRVATTSTIARRRSKSHREEWLGRVDQPWSARVAEPATGSPRWLAR